MGTSCNSTGTNVESCTWEAKIPGGNTGHSAERDTGLVSENKPNRSQQCALAAERATSILGCISRSPANQPREAIIRHQPAPIGLHQDTTSSFGSPSPGRTLINQTEYSKRPPRLLGLEQLPCGERLREQG